MSEYKYDSGLECSNCGSIKTHVINTRINSSGNIIRRRECKYCGKRFSTVEYRISDVDESAVSKAYEFYRINMGVVKCINQNQ